MTNPRPFNIMLLILPISMAIAACKHDCVPLTNCPYLSGLKRRTSRISDDYYCEIRKLVCCPTVTKPNLTISEKKCQEFANTPKFCKTENLIQHGTPAVPHETPFMVSVQKVNNTQFIWICGGTLISKKFVLTAMHCFQDIKTKHLRTVVLLGAHFTNSTGDRINVTLFPHPDNDEATLAHDIGLLELHEEVINFTDKIKPACLPKTTKAAYRDFTTAGWGIEKGDLMATELLRTSLTEHNFTDCSIKIKKNHPDFMKEFDEKRQFCTRPIKEQTDACKGDSGGPIFGGYPGKESCLFEIVGVISFGEPCDQSIASFTIHTRVSIYREWIESVVWKSETTKKL